MEGINELTVTIVGVSTVFIVFVILYTVFKIMEIVGISQNKKMKLPEQKKEGSTEKSSQERFQSTKTENTSVQNIQASESEEIAAVFAAIYSIMGENVIVKSITPVRNTVGKKGIRGWEEWRTYGWRGGNR